MYLGVKQTKKEKKKRSNFMHMKITFRTTGTCLACRCGVGSLSHTRTIKDQFISIWEMSSEENENKIVTKLRRKRVGVRILF